MGLDMFNEHYRSFSTAQLVHTPSTRVGHYLCSGKDYIENTFFYTF